MRGTSLGNYASSPDAFTLASLSGLLADFSPETALVPTGTDFAASFPADSSGLSSSDFRLRLDPVNGYTIAFWMRPHSSLNATTISSDGGGDGGFRVGPINNGWFNVYNSGGSMTDYVSASPVFGVVLDVWQFFAFVFDPANGQIRARINRDPQQSATLAGSPAAGSGVFNVGTAGYGWFNGGLGPLAVAQQVLSDAEIDEIYGSPGSVTYSALSSGLKAKLSEFWGMTEASGSRVGSKNGIVLAQGGTIGRTTGPANAQATATGTPVDLWSGGPASRWDVRAAGSARPTLVAASDSPTGTAAVRFPPGSAAVTMLGNVTADVRSLTVFHAGRSLARDTVVHPHVTLGDYNSGPGLQLNDNLCQPGAVLPGRNVVPPTIESYSPTVEGDVRAFTSDASGVALHFDDSAAVTDSPVSAGTASGIIVGGESSHYAGYEFARLVVYGRVLSGPEIARARAFLRTQVPAAPPLSATLPVVLFTGNSIHYGEGVSEIGLDIAGLAMASLGLPYGSRWRNLALRSQNTNQCTTGDPARLAAFREDSRLTVVALSELTNDIYGTPSTGAQAYDNLKACVAAYKAALPDVKITITTCLPRAGSYTARNACNTLLRADLATATAYPYVFAGSAGWAADCWLADWAAEPTMGPDGAESSGTYYDFHNIHPSDAGCALLAPISADALRAAGVS